MQQHIEEDSIDFKAILNKIIDKWYLFVASAAICLLLAFLYAHFTPPTYQVNAKVLVNDDQKGGGVGKQASALMDLGGMLGGKSSVDNEAEVLKTRFLMEQVVREMQLNIIYSRKAGLIKTELKETPFKLDIINGVDTIEAKQINIEIRPGNKFLITSHDFEKEVTWNENFKINEVGTMRLLPTGLVKLSFGSYVIDVCSIDERVAALMKRFSVSVTNKQVTIIDLSLTYPLQKKGEEILAMLIRKYSLTNILDKNAVADSTYQFIQERISIIASQLGDVENKVESFKQSNKLADMSEQSKLLVQSTGEFTNELAKAETQVSVLNDLENYLKDETKNKRVFPTSLLPSDMVFSDLMQQYNMLLIERDKQLLSVTETSPFIQNIDTQISGMRKGILSNIQSTKNTFLLTRDRLRTQLNKVESQVGSVPQIEKNYLKLARNQQIKQELYVFLMQKAEETAISKTSNISVAKVIDPPKANIKPIAPKKGISYLVALILGFIIPMIIIYGREYLASTIQTKEDINQITSVPVIGEISHNASTDNMIVANHERSAISEQFRALRTNLSFYLKNKDQKIILLTSSMSGEGKSFTAINLGNIFALAGKKVLLMELDLRKPGLSAKLGISNTSGFSNYTITPSLTSRDIIKPLTVSPNMSLISSGPLPPNPAETLLSERLPELLEDLKTQFDYIIMDAPPIGIITDAQLISDYADATIYLVRQKVTQKAQLNIVEDLYKDSKMKNIGIVVNDIQDKSYGYGYGYGNYGEEQSSNWLNKLVKRFKS